MNGLGFGRSSFPASGQFDGQKRWDSICDANSRS